MLVYSWSGYHHLSQLPTSLPSDVQPTIVSFLHTLPQNFARYLLLLCPPMFPHSISSSRNIVLVPFSDYNDALERGPTFPLYITILYISVVLPLIYVSEVVSDSWNRIVFQ